jgi:menaquinone-9 beta-reductase
MALLGAELLAPFVESALVADTADRSIQRAYRGAWHRRFIRRITLCRAFHHALVNPGLVDLASRLPTLAGRALARGFDWTRDRAR